MRPQAEASKDDSERAVRPQVDAPAAADRRESVARRASGGELDDRSIY